GGDQPSLGTGALAAAARASLDRELFLSGERCRQWQYGTTVLNLHFKAVACGRRGRSARRANRRFYNPSISSRETAAVRDLDRAYVRIGSKPAEWPAVAWSQSSAIP